jgi:hypothetical protein
LIRSRKSRQRLDKIDNGSHLVGKSPNGSAMGEKTSANRTTNRNKLGFELAGLAATKPGSNPRSRARIPVVHGKLNDIIPHLVDNGRGRLAGFQMRSANPSRRGRFLKIG